MASLAEILKNARQNAGLELKKLSEITKIQIKYLEWLEEGEYEKMPSIVYVQGFLKKYIQIFGLDEKDIMARYKKETVSVKALCDSKYKGLPILISPRLFITPKKISIILVVLVILIIGGYLIYQINYLIAAPELVLDYPLDNLTISRASIEISGHSDPLAKLMINGQQVYIDKSGAFRQEINLSKGINLLKLEAINRFGKKTELARQILVE